ncbi:uncharacterized protein LOC143179864 [Calliopsis andreniformis]|uniref:uncharacterized protein LOC143179864 n=1 Tax=Calliopsis andreniformis TaxID=337506 RepID=UPI003FCCA16D
MADQKTTINLKSLEQSMKTAVQPQITKIKKEEEEELWISGEELYTEGSSDEEEYKTQSRSRRKVNSNQSSRASSANVSVERRGHSPASTEIKTKSDNSTDISKDGMREDQTTHKNALQSVKTSASVEKLYLSVMKHQQAQHISLTDSSDTSSTKNTVSSDRFAEEEQSENTEISWKANRGSFVLPNSSNNTKEEADNC